MWEQRPQKQLPQSNKKKIKVKEWAPQLEWSQNTNPNSKLLSQKKNNKKKKNKRGLTDHEIRKENIQIIKKNENVLDQMEYSLTIKEKRREERDWNYIVRDREREKGKRMRKEDGVGGVCFLKREEKEKQKEEKEKKGKGKAGCRCANLKC